MDAGRREDPHRAQARDSRSCNRRSRNRRSRAGDRPYVWGALVPARGPAGVRVRAHGMPVGRQHDHGIRERLPGIAQLCHGRLFPELAQALPGQLSPNGGPLQRDRVLRGSCGHRHLGSVLGADLDDSAAARAPAAMTRTPLAEPVGRADPDCELQVVATGLRRDTYSSSAGPSPPNLADGDRSQRRPARFQNLPAPPRPTGTGQPDHAGPPPESPQSPKPGGRDRRQSPSAAYA